MSTPRASIATVALILLSVACEGGASKHGSTRTAPARAAGSTSTVRPPATWPIALDPDVAALPDGGGAQIAIVVDDAGLNDLYLDAYLRLPMPVTVSIIPHLPRATVDDAAVYAAGREDQLHIPLANHPGGAEPWRLTTAWTPAAIDAYVTSALARIPHAVGANNHEGSYGSPQPTLMVPLLASLSAHHRFFLDSVTSQRTVGYALEARFAMPPRINNEFLDHRESDPDSRQALLHLARIAAANHAAIGICHVYHPYVLHVLRTIGAQLEARHYSFAALSEVSDAPAAGLDNTVRST